MYKGKRHNGSRTGGKYIALLVSLVLVLSAAIGGTLAWLIDKTDKVNNQFTPSEVTTKVEETFNGNVKSNVKIKNTGDTEAYIRAAVVVTWQDASGNISHKKPVAGADYNITFPGNNWELAADGYYYYKLPVKSVAEDETNCMTEVLFTDCSPVAGRAPEGYFLTVEVLSSGIQSVPAKVVTEQWSSGVSGVNGTTLTIKK